MLATAKTATKKRPASKTKRYRALADSDYVRHNGHMRIRLTQAARKRRIGVAHIRYVIDTCDAEPVELNSGNIGLQWIGADDRGDVLEIMGLELEDTQSEPFLLITHVMPYRYRREGSS